MFLFVLDVVCLLVLWCQSRNELVQITIFKIFLCKNLDFENQCCSTEWFFSVIMNCWSIEDAISFHKVQLCILKKLKALLMNYVGYSQMVDGIFHNRNSISAVAGSIYLGSEQGYSTKIYMWKMSIQICLCLHFLFIYLDV